MPPCDDAAFARLVQRLDPESRLRRVWALTGGYSATVTALEIEGPDGGTRKLVVRQHSAMDRMRNPRIAADEFELLRILRVAGLPVPAPCCVDQSGEILPTPYLVVEYVEGETDAAPADLDAHMGQFALHLASIHAVDGTDPALAFLPRQDDDYAAMLSRRREAPDVSLSEPRIRDVLANAWPLRRRNPPMLLHGDFWSGNLLWRDGRLAAIIDWEDAAVGDPIADVAISRLELVWAFGMPAMERFTDHYRTVAKVDFTDLPYWDLWAALRTIPEIGAWAPDAAAEDAMRQGHRAFVAQAFQTV